jgi:catechol 2,3-dioxygenase-like lactoylglutathione lyase family enzyme
MLDQKTKELPPPPRSNDGKSLLAQLSHTATRTRDMEAIRRFYEDYLGLPMVATLTADFDVVTNEPSNYIHCLFEMADGSCVAFFQFEEGFREDPAPRSSDPYERHLAIRVDDKETVHRFLDRSKEFGYEAFIVDHDDFYSLYLLDPDGEQVEVTWHKPSYELIRDVDAAHRTLEAWLAKATKH